MGKPQGTLSVYQTAGEDYNTRNAADPLFVIDSESQANTSYIIDRGEIAVVQGKVAARLTEGLAWELRQILTEYMDRGRFTVGG